MELRDLRNFLAVTNAGNISAASAALHIAQPSLSRQMRELEEELGKALFIRGSRRITLTEEGLILKKRAEEILSLTEKAEKEISDISENISGDIYIGAAESEAVRYITTAAGKLRKRSPLVRLHIASGDTNDTLLRLEQGLIDFALLFYLKELERYNYISLPACDKWGILIRNDHPLAGRKSVSFLKDLKNEPLILSRLTTKNKISGVPVSQLNITGTYNLAYNAMHMVAGGLGLAVCFDSIVDTEGARQKGLEFIPITDMDIDIRPAIIWKKYQNLSRVSQAFIDDLKEVSALQ